MSESVRCFQHCQRNTNILCFYLPRICPLCAGDVMSTESRIPPYIIPSPFVDANEYPLSIVIKPTIGTFQRDFDSRSNLHVGLTDSKGNIYDYDEDGINYNSPSWNQCLAIPVTELQHAAMCNKWDKVLMSAQHSPHWTKFRYNENSYNCFDFVMNILWEMGLHHHNQNFRSKSFLCSNIVVPYTKKAAGYISLYQNIQKQGYVCQATGEV